MFLQPVPTLFSQKLALARRRGVNGEKRKPARPYSNMIVALSAVKKVRFLYILLHINETVFRNACKVLERMAKTNLLNYLGISPLNDALHQFVPYQSYLKS